MNYSSIVSKQGNNAAILFSKIAYWLARATIEKDGCKWIAKTRQNLANETGLTLKQVRTGLERLKSYNLIAIEQHKFKGISQSFIRIKEGVLEKVIAESPEMHKAILGKPKKAIQSGSPKGPSPNYIQNIQQNIPTMLSASHQLCKEEKMLAKNLEEKIAEPKLSKGLMVIEEKEEAVAINNDVEHHIASEPTEVLPKF